MAAGSAHPATLQRRTRPRCPPPKPLSFAAMLQGDEGGDGRKAARTRPPDLLAGHSPGACRSRQSISLQRRVRVSHRPGRCRSRTAGFARVCAARLAARSADLTSTRLKTPAFPPPGFSIAPKALRCKPIFGCRRFIPAVHSRAASSMRRASQPERSSSASFSPPTGRALPLFSATRGDLRKRLDPAADFTTMFPVAGVINRPIPRCRG